MAEQVKTPDTKSDDLSSSPQIHKVDNSFLQVIL